MTEDKARHYAKALAEGMGITFYVVRSREGEKAASFRCRDLPTAAKSSRRSNHPSA
jgi:hypothetical protein